MSEQDESTPGLSDGVAETVDSTAGPMPLFDGDTGTLPLNVRDAMITLLKRSHVSDESQPAEYQLIVEHEPAIRTRLNDQFLDLVVDREHKVAYKRQAVSDSGDKYPTLLYDQAYTREETILLVTLRRMLSGSRADVVFVDRSELVEQVQRYRPATATDTVGDTKAAGNAIEALIKSRLLLKTNQPDRYRIPTIVRALLDVRRLQQLLAWLQATNGTTPDGAQLSTAEAAADAVAEPGGDVLHRATDLEPPQDTGVDADAVLDVMEESA